MTLTYGSVCSGIEAATQAWHPLGWKPAFFSEIDKAARAVLTHHYPDVPLHGDFTTIEADQYDPIDLLVGGTPCQSFSIAGLRGGLGDDRGNLALEFLKLAARKKPRWLVWENVPGVFSSLSHDAPDQCPPAIDLDGDDGPEVGEEIVVTDEYDADENHALSCFLAGLSELGYGWAYRVLDAQYTRTRSLPFAVPQRRRRIIVVGYIGDWRRAAAVLFDRQSLQGDPAPRREAGQGAARGFECGPARGGFTDVAPTLDTRCKDGPIRNQLGAGVMQANSGDASYCQPVASCLNAAFGTKLGLENQHIDQGAPLFISEISGSGATHSLTAEGFDASEDGTGRGTPIIAFDTTQITSKANFSNPQPGDPCHPLAAGAHPPAIATSWAVRRLTPRECERLQGFPDDFTRIPWRGKPAEQCPDGQRYKQCGNSMAVNVMEWIGERIQLIEDISKEHTA